MAWRNIWRNQRRTWVTVAAMSLALIVIIMYQAIVQGYMHNFERNLLDSALGDIQIFAPGYRDSPSLYERIQDHQTLLGRLEQEGFGACARLLAGGLGAAGETSAGVMFVGVDVESDARVSKIYQQVISGQWLAADEPKGVVIGRRLARTLDVTIGDELVALSQAADGSLANELYRVRGVLKGISQATDRTGVFMLADSFRELMVMPQGAHQIIIRRPDTTSLDVATSTVLRLASELDVKNWRQLMPTIASMLDSTKGLMAIMSFIVYIAIGILILNAMLMAVFERVREFGVLKALGVSPTGVMGMIIWESAFQTGLAIVCGLILSVPLMWYLIQTGVDFGLEEGTTMMGIAWDPLVIPIVTLDSIGNPIIMLVVVVGMAILYPALKAALINPIKAIHHH